MFEHFQLWIVFIQQHIRGDGLLVFLFLKQAHPHPTGLEFTMQAVLQHAQDLVNIPGFDQGQGQVIDPFAETVIFTRQLHKFQQPGFVLVIVFA